MKKILLSATMIAILQALPMPAIAGTTTLADTMFRAAETYDICENYRVAADKYLDLIAKIRKTDPTNTKIIRAQARLARLYVLQREYYMAEPIVILLLRTDRKNLELEPELSIDLEELCDAYTHLGQNPQYGYKSLRSVVAIRKYIDPDHPRLSETYDYLADSCLKSGNFAEEIDWLNKAIANEKKHSWRGQTEIISDHMALLAAYQETNNFEKSLQVAHETLALIAKCNCGLGAQAQIHGELGRLYSKRGDFDQADKEFQLSMQKLLVKASYAKEWPAKINRWHHENEMLRRQAKETTNSHAQETTSSHAKKTNGTHAKETNGSHAMKTNGSHAKETNGSHAKETNGSHSNKTYALPRVEPIE